MGIPLNINSLWTRLTIATLLPVALVSMTLYPIFASHLEERIASSRQTAEAFLDSEYDMLLRSMNESFNQVLATAELPLLRQFLVRRTTSRAPEWGPAAEQDWHQMEALFDSLMTHYGRYTRLAVIDTRGLEWVATAASPMLPRPPVVAHEATTTYQETMRLQSRDLYVSPPRPGASGDSDTPVTTVIDIATPIFDDRGQRLGVLLFTLDWSQITANLPHAREAGRSEVLLVDAQGRWLLPTEGGQEERFGHSVSDRWPAAWAAMSARNQGMAMLNDHLLGFRSHDICQATSESAPLATVKSDPLTL